MGNRAAPISIFIMTSYREPFYSQIRVVGENYLFGEYQSWDRRRLWRATFTLEAYAAQSYFRDNI